MEFGYSQYTINYANNCLFCFFIKIPSTYDSGLMQLFDKLKIKEVSYEDGVAGNKAEYKSAERPTQRDTFFVDMDNMIFEELKGKYGVPTPVPLKRKIKSGIKKMLIKVKIIGGV